ncbi:hypothetical protein RP75_06035 [Agrobacterium arsenijevicii]|uniref:Uncharacterized protein n=2 Tax=Agrobacterium arsenijevicii TaxID=1585697 RepID=A0ABR5DC58_9HYPH|nr:hypothetical protein RP75_06035 [Agrobacterium arsenijevicii]
MFNVPRVVVLAFACIWPATHGYSAEHVDRLERVKRNYFFASAPGEVGIVNKTGCNKKEGFQPGTYVRMVGPNKILWGFSPKTRCIRFVLNHKSESSVQPPQATYLAAKIVGLYEEDGKDKIVARREGIFSRDGSQLPRYLDYVDEDSASAREAQKHFETGHKKGDLAALDNLIGKWHGVPDEGVEDTWTERRRLTTPLPRLAQREAWKSRIIDYRLYRFVPFDGAAGPSGANPLDIIVHPNGASALVVKFYSPEGAEYGGEFVVLLTEDEEEAGRMAGEIKVSEGKNFFDRLFGQ